MAWGLHPNPGGSKIICYACRAWWYKYPADSCGTCSATVPLRDGVCRACRHQAAFVAGRIKVPSAGHGARLDLTVAAATGHQTFLADLIKWNRRHHLTARTAKMPELPSETPHRHPLLLKPPESIQLTLFEPVRDFRRYRNLNGSKGRSWTGFTPADPSYADFLVDRARDVAAVRGWNHCTIKRVKCGLMILSALHQPSERIKATTVHALSRDIDVPAVHLIDILNDLDILLDDAPDPFEQLVSAHLAVLPEQIRLEVTAYFDVLRNGAPRRRPRSPHTVDIHLRLIVPFAAEYCAPRYSTLRQVTPEDITVWLSKRNNVQREIVALRDMFKTLKSQRLIFADPARRIRPGNTLVNPPTPVAGDQLKQVARAAAESPALLAVVALAGIHALFPHEIRMLQDADIELSTGRLRRGEVSRPLDDFTAEAIRKYRRYRDARWPDSANPHLLLTQQTAKRKSPVSDFWLKRLFKGLPATADSLRQDRVLEEAIAAGPDPLRIATMFNLSAQASLRYTRAAGPAGIEPTTGHSD